MPNTIKRKELESYLEEYAVEQGIAYEKKTEPTKTIYTFTIEGEKIIGWMSVNSLPAKGHVRRTDSLKSREEQKCNFS